jgi:hypothetical protein
MEHFDRATQVEKVEGATADLAQNDAPLQNDLASEEEKKSLNERYIQWMKSINK